MYVAVFYASIDAKPARYTIRGDRPDDLIHHFLVIRDAGVATTAIAIMNADGIILLGTPHPANRL